MHKEDVVSIYNEILLSILHPGLLAVPQPSPIPSVQNLILWTDPSNGLAGFIPLLPPLLKQLGRPFNSMDPSCPPSLGLGPTCCWRKPFAPSLRLMGTTSHSGSLPDRALWVTSDRNLTGFKGENYFYWLTWLRSPGCTGVRDKVLRGRLEQRQSSLSWGNSHPSRGGQKINNKQTN